MMSFVFTTTQKIQNLQYDRKNQKSDQFTDRQAYTGTSNMTRSRERFAQVSWIVGS